MLELTIDDRDWLLSLPDSELETWLSTLSRDRQTAILSQLDARAAEATLRQWIPHEPTERQREFLSLNCLEAMYGGAAGGGKSDAMLMAAAQYVDRPNYRALLLRRTITDLDLPEALMNRAKGWWASKARWHDKKKTFHFPSGATITFGYLEHENDKYRYQGAEFQFIGFDELTQFTESQYTYLFSRLRRRKGSDLPIRMRAASNPGGVGHAWVKERFIANKAASRSFVRATLQDNPHIDREEYEQSLDNLDPFTRAQLLKGDWEEYKGGLFLREWFAKSFVDERQLPEDLRWVRFWDFAATEKKPGTDPDWSCGCRMGKSSSRPEVYMADMVRERKTPGAIENLVLATAGMDGIGTEICIEQEPGSAGVFVASSFAKLLMGYRFRSDRPTGDKKVRAGPLSSYAEKGLLKLVRGAWNKPFLDECELFPFGQHDDQVDAASGCFARLANRKQFFVAGV